MHVIVDTNVLVAALKSSLGASHLLLTHIVSGRVKPAVTSTLIVEYESVLKRPGLLPKSLADSDITDFLDWFVSVSTHHKVHYLWRPRLRDPNDDMVLEAAMASSSRYIITFNTKDFHDVASLGVAVFTPAQFLKHCRL